MSAAVAREVSAAEAPARAATRRATGAGAGIATAAVMLFAAVGPLLPTNDLKTDATVLGGFVLALGLYVWWRFGTMPRRSGIDAPLIALLAAATLATLFSVDRFLSFFPSTRRGEGLVVLGISLLMALAAARLDRRRVGVLIGAMLAVGTLIALVAVAQFYGVDPAERAGFRAVTQNEFYGLPVGPPRLGPLFGLRSYGTLANPIFLGGYIVLLLPFAVTMAASGRRRWWLYGIAAVCLQGALIGSQTRAAWIAAFVSGAVLMVRLRGANLDRRRLAALGIVLLVVTVGMPLTQPKAPLIQRVASAVDPGDKALAERIYLGKKTLPLIARRPLLGWGFSTLLGRFPDLGSPEYVRVYGWNPVGIDSPHNELLHVAYSIGLVGLAAYLWVWARLVRILWRGRTGDGAASHLSTALLASLAGYFLWLQLAWNHIGPAQVFWTLAGLAGAVAGGTGTPEGHEVA